MKYATLADGFPTGFYSEEINGENIPVDAIQITDSQWREFIDNSGLRRWVNGEVVVYTPPPVEPPFPSIVSASQAKIALLNAGLLDSVDAMVAAHPYRPVRIWYADANQWERGHAYVQALGAELGLSGTDIDNLFVAASIL